MLHPMLIVIVVKLASYVVSAHSKLGAIIIERVVVIFGPDNDLHAGGGEASGVDRDTEDGLGVESPARPGMGADERRRTWCAYGYGRDPVWVQIEQPMDELSGQHASNVRWEDCEETNLSSTAVPSQTEPGDIQETPVLLDLIQDVEQ